MTLRMAFWSTLIALLAGLPLGLLLGLVVAALTASAVQSVPGGIQRRVCRLEHPHGDVRARVVRRVLVEDGVRLELELSHLKLSAFSSLPGPEPGAEVRLRLAPGVVFGA